MRVLQVLWDGGGNVPQQLLIARGLVGRGHEVRILAPSSLRQRIERAGATYVAYELAPEGSMASPEEDFIRDWEAKTPIGAFARYRDRLIYGPSLLFARDTIAALERHPADVVAFDYLVLGAGVGAEAAGAPSAMIIHNVYPFPAEGVPPFGQGLKPARGPLGRARDAALTRVFMRSFAPGLKALNAARAELGLDPLGAPFEQLERADLALVLTSPEFDFAGKAPLPANVRYAGPVLDHGAAGWESPWPEGDARPLVLGSFSTTYQAQDKLARAFVEALRGLPARGLLTTGPAVNITDAPIPENVEVREWAPHGPVLAEAGAAVCHAGLGTVHAALAAGVPLVCVPHGRDQDDTAVRVLEAGAGVRLPRKAGSRKLRTAISSVLEDPTFREGAERMASAFAKEDGATRVAEELEALAS